MNEIAVLQAIAHFFGLDNLSGPYYGFWSGIGSDLGEVTIIAAMVSVYRRHNCHVKGCWRVGKHPVDGTSFVVCARHHPEGEPTHATVLERHSKARKAKG